MATDNQIELPEELKQSGPYQAGLILGHNLINMQEQQRQLMLHVGVSEASGVTNKNYGIL